MLSHQMSILIVENIMICANSVCVTLSVVVTLIFLLSSSFDAVIVVALTAGEPVILMRADR